jgi:HK97 family phage prohead protease
MKKQTTKQDKVTFSFPVQIMKYAGEAGDFHIVGYAATTDFDLQGDVITEAALKASSHDLLTNSTVLLNHDMQSPIGKVTKVQFDKHGLLIDALISQTEPGIIKKIQEGVLNKFSIRGQVLDRERKYSPEHERVVNTINRLSLIEVSLVAVPANPAARAIGWYIAKALEIPEEGAKQMPEEVIVEKLQPESPPPKAEVTEPAKPPATPEPAPMATIPDVPKDSGAAPADAFKQVQEQKPAEVHKANINVTKAQLEPIFALLEKVMSLGGQAAELSLQIKAHLLKMTGETPSPSPVPAGISKAEAEKLIEGEVRKQVEAHIKAMPPLRKGLIQQDTDGDEVRKQFENLSPDQKLRAALSFREVK